MNLLNNRKKLIDEFNEARRELEARGSLEQVIEKQLKAEKITTLFDFQQAPNRIAEIGRAERGARQAIEARRDLAACRLRESAPDGIDKFKAHVLEGLTSAINTFRPKKIETEAVKTTFGDTEERSSEVVDREILNTTLGRFRQLIEDAEGLKLIVVNGSDARKGLQPLEDEYTAILRDMREADVFEPAIRTV